MAKDPAFLFYSADFIVGTYEMTDEQVGRYIRLMCLQHQKGHLSESVVLSVMGGEIDREVIGKLKRDDDGLYYNERLEEETNKRRKYSESRAKNRKGGAVSKSNDSHMSNICNSYDEHMVNENENVNVNTISSTDNSTGTAVPKQPKRFKPPSVDEVRAYCRERKNQVDAEKFVDYYTSNGWKVGKNNMKDWKAAVRTWERNGYSNATPKEDVNWA
jgi:hypothetical protein